MSSKPVNIPIIGLEIDRKADLLTFVAFILALIATGTQFTGFIRGAQVQLFAPEQVTLVLEENPVDRKPYLRIAARMAYANTGRMGYNDTVHREQVEFSLGNKPYRQPWQSEQQITTDEKGELLQKYLDEAGPFPIVAGSSVSREVYFAPFPERCGNNTLDCDELEMFITPDVAVPFIYDNKVMKLTFKSDLLGQRTPLTSKCEIDIGPDVAWNLTFKKWVSLPCFELPEKNRLTNLFWGP